MEDTFNEGLSVLIPIFNYSIIPLLKELSHQASQSGIPFEIICMDDCSLPEWKITNQHIESFPGVTYKQLPSNVGRSKIRNLLFASSKFSCLLFLDCDTKIEKKDFLKNYWDLKDCPVIVGGREYTTLPPQESKYKLHWVVGKKREEFSAGIRMKHPYKSLMFNNIFIHKTSYQQIQLDEKITTYGHEDTKFGYMLQSLKIPVLHIDNPGIHVGLDDTTSFLKKTIEGVENLQKLIGQGIGQDTLLYHSYSFLKKIGMAFIFIKLYNFILKKMVYRNLHSDTPSLVCFDIYKLASLIEANKKK